MVVRRSTVSCHDAGQDVRLDGSGCSGPIGGLSGDSAAVGPNGSGRCSQEHEQRLAVLSRRSRFAACFHGRRAMRCCGARTIGCDMVQLYVTRGIQCADAARVDLCGGNGDRRIARCGRGAPGRGSRHPSAGAETWVRSSGPHLATAAVDGPRPVRRLRPAPSIGGRPALAPRLEPSND